MPLSAAFRLRSPLKEGILILILAKLSTFSNKKSFHIYHIVTSLILKIAKDRHLLFVDKVR
jgi:hypothetical protein